MVPFATVIDTSSEKTDCDVVVIGGTARSAATSKIGAAISDRITSANSILDLCKWDIGCITNYPVRTAIMKENKPAPDRMSTLLVFGQMYEIISKWISLDENDRNLIREISIVVIGTQTEGGCFALEIEAFIECVLSSQTTDYWDNNYEGDIPITKTAKTLSRARLRRKSFL
jgi:hypothetical protein